MSKPVLLMYEQDDDRCLLKAFADLIQENFEIVWQANYDELPEKYTKIISGIIIFVGKPQITEELIKSLPNLKVIANIGVGYNHVNVEMVRSHGIRFSNTPNVLNEACAEMGMTLMLSAARWIPRSIKMTADPNFKFLLANYISPVQVSGATLGIIGMGRIGLTLARMARGFKMNILYHNRSKNPNQDAVSAKFYPKLNDMLPLCDFVAITACLTPETTKIVGAEQFKLMKKTAILMNISRGETVDQEALVAALKNDEILGAALDVTSPEPLPRNHPLVGHPKVLITPHTGSATFPTRKAMVELAVQNVLAALNGAPMPSEVFQ